MLHALANDERRAILELLLAHGAATGLTVIDVAAQTGVTRFSASHHLGVLRAVGLVVQSRDGARRLHTLSTDALSGIFDWLDPFVEALDPHED
ncbi:ArsR/SmtB family transcription factor [Microbacterium sp. CPCC 204701]|uniref:ArsR/SmtB family transcription factor n=1 Tax=Microbacterium sp. CPCC 204701 TaxID=2493084 RepID=UPI00197C2461|nr:helix-turn-helix domain-containing protein [Microbacterium sp. CPCC 204701]